jgi:hypothetical protein
MAITNYTELQAALANWMDRDLSARAPEFISLAEVVLNSKIDTRDREFFTPLTATVG